MLTSVRWLNDYLDPPASAEEQGDLLTRAGFPLEGSEPVEVSDGEDVRQDFEMTSNRGDCVCHLGLARELAAISGRTLRSPLDQAAPKPTGPAASTLITITNHEKSLCPLYTGRIIRSVKVGPSPMWLADRLRARGDIPRNNIVDATNFVLFELGQPTHVFDLKKLRGSALIIRKAKRGEPFLPIGEGALEVKLDASDLVIADAERAVAIAGVKGGALTAVTSETNDILIEAASFDPVTVRNTSRRLGIASDSSYRFERGVHPAHVNRAADRLAALILELAGGELCEGVVHDGAPIPQARTVTMRSDRCRKILGLPITDEQMHDSLARLGFEPQHNSGSFLCTVPVHRLDIEREVDLIEEVGRMIGYDTIPINETMSVRVAPPQPTELARQAVATTLVGMGFVETVTHSLVSEQAARAFLPPAPPHMSLLRTEEQRAGAEPFLRPSILPSLLRVFALNRDNFAGGGAEDIKLFESASTFARIEQGHLETRNVALVHHAAHGENPLRFTRGVIDRLIELLRGPDAEVAVESIQQIPWMNPCAVVRHEGQVLGLFGMITPTVLNQFGLAEPVCAAELGLPALYEAYPPDRAAHPLPSFPSIDRDLSVIVDERTSWNDLHATLEELDLDELESISFVTAFRGKPIPAGRKSVTVRIRFRATDRTLKHEEVDPQIAKVVQSLEKSFSAELRK